VAGRTVLFAEKWGLVWMGVYSGWDSRVSDFVLGF
jgi:hypothetical protein